MSCTQFHSIKLFILRHAWLNLWDKHMTTGRINQVTFHRSVLSKTLRKRIEKRTTKKVCSPKTSTIWRCLFNVSLISFPWLMFIQEKLHSNTENRPLQNGGEGRCELLPWFPCSPFTTEIGTKRAGKTHSQCSWQVSRLCETQIVLERAEPSTEHPHKNWWTSFCGRNSQVGCTLWIKHHRFWMNTTNAYTYRFFLFFCPAG